MTRLLSYVLVFTALWIGQSSRAQTEPTGVRPAIPILKSPVYDETGSLSPKEVALLEKKLRAFEDSTTAQVAIMIIRTLNGYPAREFATEAGNKNRLGQAKKNNGALILLSIEDREWFIATGYGLERTIKDEEAAQIGRDLLVPQLREGKFFAGLDTTIGALMGEIPKGE